MDATSYSYGNAILPTKFTICGVELRPFCLGHLILLEQLKNPLVREIEIDNSLSEGILHLYTAIIICSMSYEDGVDVLWDDKKFQKIVDQFCTNLLKNLEVENWNIFDKLNMFKSYLKYHMDMPIYTEERENNSTPSGTDWKQNMFVIFKKLGYRESDILNMNMKKLFFEWCSFAEGEGAIKVINKFDLEQLNNLQHAQH